MSSRKGIKIKREDFKSLKDEIKNIKGNINEEMYNAGVFMNEKEEYVWRANKKKLYEKSSPEKKFDLNEILKFYELNKDKYIQGFTSNYFRKLSDLMAKNKYKKYPKERLDLFNSRINNSQKIYINYLKKNGRDSEIKSSINKKIKTPFVTSLHSYNSKIYKNKNENRKIQKSNLIYNNYIQNQKSFLSSNKSTFSNNEYDKKIVKIKVNNKYDSNEFLSWKKELNSSNTKNKSKNKFLTKYFSYKNMLKTNKNNSKELEKNFSFSYYKKNKLNSSGDNIYDGKEEFFKDLDKDKYHNYLRNQYQFFDDYYIDKNKINFELKTKKRKDLFNLKPNSKFLEKVLKNVKKSDFFNKIKRNIKNENIPIIKINNSNKIIYKNKDRGLGLPSLSARFLKTMKFNNDCNLIYKKYKETLI